jgi:Tol biopolymer transport system component
MAFLRQADGEDAIYVVPALGGTEHKLYTTPRTLYPSLAWSPDGRMVAFAGSDPGHLSSRITLLSLADSRTRQLTLPPAAYLDSGPAFSPDGSQVFIGSTVAGVANDLFVVPVAGGEPRRLTFDNRPIFGLTWTSNGKDLIYSSIRGGSAALWRVPAARGTPQVVEGVGLMAFSPSISRRGNELAYQQANGKDNLWRVAVKGGRRLPGPATIAIAAKVRKLRPNFSPDGKRIAFESDRLGSMEIWSCDSNGINCAQLTSLHGTAGTAHWSPDGQSIAFEFHPGEHAEIYVVDEGGGAPRKIPPCRARTTSLPAGRGTAGGFTSVRSAEMTHFNSSRFRGRGEPRWRSPRMAASQRSNRWTEIISISPSTRPLASGDSL